MILGITGCPGSGKTTLANYIAENGWELLSVDRLGHDVVQGSASIIEKLTDRFGSEIIGKDGSLDRAALARNAFADLNSVRLLNEAVHPELISELKTILGCKRKSNHIIVDCALIFEWNIEQEFDYVVTVAAEEKVRVKRMRDRDKRPESVIRGILAAQLPESEKILRADVVIRNDREIARLRNMGRMLATLSVT